jgi:hypothetical protein
MMRLFTAAFSVALLSHAAARVTPQFSTDTSIFQPSTRADVKDNVVDHQADNIFMRQEIAFFDDDTASAGDWATFTNKGGALVCAMAGTDRTAGILLKDTRTPPSAASVWTGDLRQELIEWYWHDLDASSKTCQINEFWELSHAMQSLGLDGRPKANDGDNECFRIEHWDSKKEDKGQRVPAINQWYKVSGANYRVSF